MATQTSIDSPPLATYGGPRTTLELGRLYRSVRLEQEYHFNTGAHAAYQALLEVGDDLRDVIEECRPPRYPFIQRWLRGFLDLGWETIAPNILLNPDRLLDMHRDAWGDGLPEVLIGQVWRYTRGWSSGGSSLRNCEVYICDVIGDTAYWQMDKDAAGQTPAQLRCGSVHRRQFQPGGWMEFVRYAGFQT